MVLRFKNHLIAAALFVLLAAIGAVMNSRQVAAQGPPDGLAVRIVNPLPVPTQGASTVSGTVAATQGGPWNVGVNGTVASTQSGPWNVGVNGTVGATQSGSWNVGVTGAPSVIVTNAVLPVSGTVQSQQNGIWNVGLTGDPTVNLNTSPASPLIVASAERAVSQPFAANFNANGGGAYSVPAGKQAVIELVTFQNFGQDNGFYWIQLETTLNSQTVVYSFGPTFVQHYATASSNYTFGNHNVRLYVDPGSSIVVHTQFSGGAQGGVSISGFLVNYP